MRAACLRHRPTVPMQRSAVFVRHVVIAVVILLHAILCVSSQSATRANRHHSTTVSVITSLTAVPTHSKNNAQPCAAGASGLQFDDVASRTVKAPIVLEGRIVRMLRPSTSGADTSPVTNAVYAVTRILKGKLAAEVPKSNATVIIGPFSASAAGRSKSGDRCDVKLPTLPPLSSPQQQQQLFIAFASQLVPSDPQNNSNVGGTGVVGYETQPFYRISGQLVAATKQVVKEVQSHSCPQCGRKPSGVVLSPGGSKLSVVAGNKLQLECKGQGKPMPKFSWYKNDVPLRSTSALQIKNSKRSSKIFAAKATEDNSGVYKCRATNVIDSLDTKAVVVTVSAATSGPLSLSEKSHSQPCPSQDFCLNGGTCYIFSNLRSEFCECHTSFIGRRCEEKRVTPSKVLEPGSVSDLTSSNSMDYFLVIAVAAIAFTVSMATAVFVCCRVRYRKLCCPTNRKSSAASDLRIKRLLKQNNAEHLASQGRGEVNSYIGSGRFSSSSPSEVAPCYAGCMCLNHPQPSDLYNALPTSSSRMSTGNGRADLGNLTSYGSRQAAPSSSNSSSADAENLPLTREKVAVPKDRTRVAPPAANGVVEDPCVAGRGRKSLGSGARRSLQRASQNSADYPHDSDPEATVV